MLNSMLPPQLSDLPVHPIYLVFCKFFFERTNKLIKKFPAEREIIPHDVAVPLAPTLDVVEYANKGTVLAYLNNVLHGFDYV